jgi:hypothetical protein
VILVCEKSFTDPKCKPQSGMTTRVLAALCLAAASSIANGQAPAAPALVTVENYNRAQTDVYFAGVVKSGALGKFLHGRELARTDQRGIIRPNRDTLYSFAVFDLDAGPVTITLPAGARRFMGMQVINEGQYTPAVYHDAGPHTLTRDRIGTRYAMAIVRFLVNFSDQSEVRQVHTLQDAIKVSIKNPGTFEIPTWDEASLKKVRTALLELGTTVSDTRRMYGANSKEVDPVKHLIGSAMLWGGIPEREALYLPVTPSRNDGSTIYRLTVGDVPVNGFWSLTVYDGEGYFQPNPGGAHSLNSITVKKGLDGFATIQFGNCEGTAPNCLPITQGWNYTVRLFLPRREILDGSWTFPVAQPVN